jgi:bifunctional DNA-binding transcriptional regulator/antitoxin component of YhaV-PrlF toxin-antitoxin module
MKEFRGRIASGGRIVIPAALRREYGLGEAQEVAFLRGERGLELRLVPQSMERAQEGRQMRNTGGQTR